LLEELRSKAVSELVEEGVEAGQVSIRLRRLFLRLEGQESAIEVDATAGAAPREAFAKAYRRLFGYDPGARRIEVESIRVVACGPSGQQPRSANGPARSSRESRSKPFFDAETAKWTEVPILERREMSQETVVDGPLLIAEDHSVTVVELGWAASCDEFGDLRLVRGGE
ncbi:MAG: hypothetical protein OES47_15660, partial [Acidobacteriota bacterium]|nr:hypothetical protein [Acidobacteriota bacterium]